MDIDDLINLLQDPGDDGVPDTIYDDLRSAHTTAIDSATEGANAKISELTQTNDEANAEIERLKLKNWELFEQVPKAGDSDPEGPTDETTLDGADLDLDTLITDQEEG